MSHIETTSPQSIALRNAIAFGQQLARRVALGDVTATEAATLLFSAADAQSPARLKVTLIVSLELTAWLTDSLEVEFRTALNHLIVDTL